MIRAERVKLAVRVAVVACAMAVVLLAATATAFAAPAVNTEGAETPALGSATVHGSVNPENAPVEACYFEWGQGEPGGAFEHSVSCAQTPVQIGSGNASVPVSAELSGLAPYDAYHYRLVARESVGTTDGQDMAMWASVDAFGIQTSGPIGFAVNVSDPNAEHPTIAESGFGGSWQVANPQAPDSQAGSHPFAVTTRFVVNTEADGNISPDLQPKDYYVNIPAGFAGSVAKIPRCKISTFDTFFDLPETLRFCPTASQVGVLRWFAPNGGGAGKVQERSLTPVYNVVPPPGVPAELAFSALLGGEPVTMQLRSDGDYGVTAEVRNVTERAEIDGANMTLWGVPANHAHDSERFLPENPSKPGANGQPLPADTPEVPFLNNPTKCGEVQDATVTTDAWRHPGKLAEDGRPVPGGENWVTARTQMYPHGITGCSELTFEPQIEVKPSTSVADSSMGMTVDIKVPQNEEPSGLETPALRNATVTLPQGISINPSEANGLEGCTPAQIKLHSEAAPECPNASQIGKLELKTPLLAESLSGQIYLSSEHSGNVFHMFLVIEGQGVLMKLEGSVEANEKTGQIVSTFKENPQLQFSEMKLTFYGGSEAALATPQQCGAYTTTSSLEPWSQEGAEKELGRPVSTPSPLSSFAIGSGCANAFAPSFTAGTTNPVAGNVSPFSLTFSRKDGEQDLGGISMTLPPGLTGKIAGVQECSNAQIEAAEHSSGASEQANPSCPAGSRLGTVQTGAGVGGKPFYLGGSVYLTGPYKGAPFGLVEIVPALAGPFDLGTVVVRQTINIDPHTAQVSVASDPLPTIIDGIPLRIRAVHVEVNRPEFMLNPTSCEVMHIDGALLSTSGTQAAESSRMQVGECASLKFTPDFSVSTSAKTSRKDGASLDVKIVEGQAGEANVKSVHVELPKALPSRLSTLNHACVDTVFEANPAACPAESRVGSAKAITPLLPVAMEGPAYFVSHGGQKFPELVMVLQGDGVTIELSGETFISKAGITSSTYKAVPDVPVSSFELMLPEGPYSALAANTSLCAAKLAMPTTITAQNGAVIKQSTKIAVGGCKSAIRVLSHRVKGVHAHIRVQVPSAGTLVATGKGLKRSVKRVAKAKVVTIAVTLSKRDLNVLAKHPRQRVNAKVTLTFRRKGAAPLRAHVRLLMS
jgi:hypothetical protein